MRLIKLIKFIIREKAKKWFRGEDCLDQTSTFFHILLTKNQKEAFMICCFCYYCCYYPSAVGYFFSFFFFRSRIGGAIPIVYTYFTEFLQMDKRGEHLSWLCMFWMLGGLYASFTAWGIIPHYGNRQHLGLSPRFGPPLTHTLPTGLQVGALPSARSSRCTAGGYLSWCVFSRHWLH